MSATSSSLRTNDVKTNAVKENQQPITGLGQGDIAPTVFLCGDPARINKVSAKWDDTEEVCCVREYTVHTGSKDGVALSAASTGIGAPSTAFIMEQLANLGATTFIRIGNSGALGDDVALGDYVVTTASIRDEGTTRSYVRPEFPAASDYRVTAALVAAAAERDATFHTGVSLSVDGFYPVNKVLGEDGALLPMSHKGYQQSFMNNVMLDAKAAGAKNIEMESSTILTLASLFGLRAGCICTVSDRCPWPGPGQDSIALDQNIDGAIDIAIAAALQLAP